MKKLEVLCLNQSDMAMPKAFLRTWIGGCERALKRRLSRSRSAKLSGELTVVFLNSREARALNREFRRKDYATDVLSFESETGLGELVLCPQVLKRQAREHGLSFREELGYLVLHGVLHLLGFEHERGGRRAKEMYALQDLVFEGLRRSSRQKKSRAGRARLGKAR
jgi:probable rRNA maturation factor